MRMVIFVVIFKVLLISGLYFLFAQLKITALYKKYHSDGKNVFSSLWKVSFFDNLFLNYPILIESFELILCSAWQKTAKLSIKLLKQAKRLRRNFVENLHLAGWVL